MFKIASPLWTEILFTIAIVIIGFTLIALVTRYVLKKMYNAFPDDIMQDENEYKYTDDIFE